MDQIIVELFLPDFVEFLPDYLGKNSTKSGRSERDTSWFKRRSIKT